MKKILVCCGTGVATSTMAVKKIGSALEKMGKADQVTIGQCKVAEMKAKAKDYDLVVSTTVLKNHDFETPYINGLPFVSGVGIDKCMAEVVNILWI
ncbi:PTS sugar transporter subunit IIB [Eubacterium aggregans]|uniref:PTS sugar transporter subunit IIB n=1 Tax=Eubacterium aggregans TaxID=81409 RepID=UPI003F3C44B5